MTSAPEIDVRDLKSVRRATMPPDIVLGEDWVDPEVTRGGVTYLDAPKRGIIALRKSPIARKIVVFNLIAMFIMIAGVLYLNASRDNLAFQRANGLISEAQLIADVFEVQLPSRAAVNLVTGHGINAAETLANLNLRGGMEVSVFAPDATLVARTTGALTETGIADLDVVIGRTFISDLLGTVTGGLFGLFNRAEAGPGQPMLATATPELIAIALQGKTQLNITELRGSSVLVVVTPIMRNGVPVGVIAAATAAGEVDSLVRREREEVLRLLLVGIAVSIGLSLVLASTIANPLADLATAAEASHHKNARKLAPVRVRIPDLTARPDEIGRLSGALRGMVSALYDRIESNEQFAADVAHEIKNPLASLRSAVGTMRIATQADQRERMLDLIEHDIKRLDRLISDISNASRLDSELVKEKEETFDLITMLHNVNDHLGREAEAQGISFIADVPRRPIMVQGLEGRLAQVFVNLICNAISFCEQGDAIRVWTRTRENRVLVVVEDTGPGIPDGALRKIFQRFYSERPAGQFGNNSGLGLAISKQIVEAHGGVIWAENIRPTDADPTSEPAGARFVVGLPL
ncbi:MAG: sensor histidine kinase [Loktanella sp.]|nr:sensor histidine kinase [Loktanella sp.]